jgi:hypothetical protein
VRKPYNVPSETTFNVVSCLIVAVILGVIAAAIVGFNLAWIYIVVKVVAAAWGA